MNHKNVFGTSGGRTSFLDCSCHVLWNNANIDSINRGRSGCTWICLRGRVFYGCRMRTIVVCQTSVDAVCKRIDSCRRKIVYRGRRITLIRDGRTCPGYQADMRKVAHQPVCNRRQCGICRGIISGGRSDLGKLDRIAGRETQLMFDRAHVNTCLYSCGACLGGE
jgi:hypothetical protein